MACKSCGKGTKVQGVQTAVVEKLPSVDFTTLTTKRASVRVRKKNYSLLGPLIKIKPPTGYGINLLVGDHKHRVEGTSAKQVVADAIALYKINGIEIDERSAWLNANLYWMGQLSVKHHLTTVEELQALAAPTTDTVFGKPKIAPLEDPSPEDWGGSAWRFMGAYIAQGEFFTTHTLNQIVDILFGMLSDPFIGCEDCKEHFATRVAILDDQLDNYDDDDLGSPQMITAKWMWETMNLIRQTQGRATLTWEAAVKEHRWENLK